MSFVIKYTMAPQSYYLGSTRLGPKFGATLAGAVRYETRELAIHELNGFPLIAAACSDIEEVRE